MSPPPPPPFRLAPAGTGANKGRFKFKGIGSAYEFNKMIAVGIITVNNAPATHANTYWGVEVDPNVPSNSYFFIYLL